MVTRKRSDTRTHTHKHKHPRNSTPQTGLSDSVRNSESLFANNRCRSILASTALEAVWCHLAIYRSVEQTCGRSIPYASFVEENRPPTFEERGTMGKGNHFPPEARLVVAKECMEMKQHAILETPELNVNVVQKDYGGVT